MVPVNPILAAAAANMAVGMLWYSDYAFGPMWRKLKKEGNVEYKDLYQRLALQAVASVMVTSALYIAIMTFQKTQMIYAYEHFTNIFSWFLRDKQNTTELIASMKTVAFIWLGFVVPGGLSCLAWSTPMSWVKFGIKTGCKLAQFLAVAAVLATLA